MLIPTDNLSPTTISGNDVIATEQSPDFRFRITPHRSLSDRAFLVMMAMLVGAAIAAQLFFLAIGVWIAGVAALLNAAFLVAAFIACRIDQRRLETVSLASGILNIERTRGNGQTTFADTLPAFGLTICTTTDPDFGCRKLELLHRRQTVEIGRDLSPAERGTFARALVASLRGHGFSPRLEELETLPLFSA